MITEIIKQPNINVINMLKNMLEKAEKGEIQSVAIAGIWSDCKPFNLFDAEYKSTALIGELRLLERDIVDLYCKIRKDVSWEYVE